MRAKAPSDVTKSYNERVSSLQRMTPDQSLSLIKLISNPFSQP